MILVAPEIGSKELLPYIKKIGVPAEIQPLPYGDFCFAGNGPHGEIYIGVERKTLHDLLHCIDDARYGGFQKPGMQLLYTVKYLMVEAIYKPKEDGLLMEGNEKGQYWICRPGGKPVLYSKVRRYLMSASLSSVIVTHTRSMFETAYDLCEMYHYFNKRWDEHTSMLEMPKAIIPSITGKPSLCLKWAHDLDGVGLKYSLEAEKLFRRKARLLANSEESDWMKIKGIGAPTAMKIIKEING